MKNIKLALLNIQKNVKNEKELKSSFIISIVGMVLNNIAFLIIWYYFGKTVGIINGWKPTDIFGLYGFSGIAYGVIVTIFGGLFDLPTYISSGTFDKYLTTPKNILLKVSTSKIRTSAIGDLAYGIICLIVFIVINKLNFIQILLSILLSIIVCIVFYAFSLICMSISFYLMDGNNVSSGLYGIFISNSLYHGGAFTGVLRFVFMFIIPSLFIGAIPVEIVNTLSINKLLLIIGISVLWLEASIVFFYRSKRRYESNNLFGFGS